MMRRFAVFAFLFALAGCQMLGLTAVATLGAFGVLWPLLIVIPLLIATGWLMVPRRSWWGSGPMASITDPDLRKNWRRSEIRFSIIAFVVITVVVPAFFVFSGIAPAQP
jgi:hypothetical protein